MKRARLQAAITGKAREVGAIESHEKNVLAITRAIHRMEQRLRVLTKEQKELRGELRARRRELRQVLQRDTSIDLEKRLEAAGQADGADRALALAEARRS